MRNKLLVGFLLIMFCLAGTAFAADSPRTAGRNDLNYVVGVADTGDGNCLEVDSDGSAVVRPFHTTLTSISADGTAIASACYVYSISVSGTASGDYADIYDAGAVSGTKKARVRAGTSGQSSTINFLGGATFSTAVYVDCQNTNQVVTIEYDK